MQAAGMGAAMQPRQAALAGAAWFKTLGQGAEKEQAARSGAVQAARCKQATASKRQGAPRGSG